jgi:predicted nucleic-acid-binding Zn-ribbon protein
MTDQMTCPKCAQAMLRGFISEISQRSDVSLWVEDEPEESFCANGVKVPQDRSIKIVTYRCSNCGFLESYAPK